MRTLFFQIRTVVLAIATTAALAAGAATAAAQDVPGWCKFERGNVWNLEDQATGQTREVRCDYSDRSFRYVSGLFGGDFWFWVDRSYPSLYVWNADDGAWSFAARFGVTNTRTTWDLDPTGSVCEDYKARWASFGTTISTPAGRFTNCRQLTLQLTPPPNVRCVAPPEASIWFKYGVGIVKVTTPLGEEYLLKSAIVGNAVYPATPAPTGGFATTVTLDKSSYQNRPNTIRCIRAPCPSNQVNDTAKVTFTVRNDTGASKTFNFSSGCQFNVEIADQNGRAVAALSDRIFCTMAFSNFTLRAGESKTFQADMELIDRSDLQLDGTFTVRAFVLPGQGNATIEARAPLSVVVR